MAVLVLPAIIGAEIGTFAWFAAVAVGSYIDSAFVIPTLFGKTTEGPKLDDIPVGRWSEGTGLPRAYGKVAPVPGTVIWQSPLREVKDTQNGGGKGGSGGSFIVYKYYADVAIALCEGPISRVTKLFADGKVIYNIAPDIDYTSTQISGAVTSYTYYETLRYELTLTSSGSGSPNLSSIKSGKAVEIDIGTASGTFTCTQSGVDVVAGTTTCTLKLGSTAATFSDWAIGAKTVSLYQKLPTFSGEHVSSIRFHLGTSDQLPDPLMEAYDGEGEVPAYRDTCYIVLEQLALQDWGNRIPSFSAVVEEDVARTVPQVIAELLEEGGLSSAEYDVSGLLETEFEGMASNGISSVAADLQPILMAEDIIVQQIGDVLVFKQRSDVATVEVEAEHLGLSDTLEQWAPMSVQDEDPLSLPDEVAVSYVDVDNEYDTGTSRHTRVDPLSREVLTVNLPLAMNAEKARAIASRLFWQAMQARTVEFPLPPEYLHNIFEGTLLKLVAFEQTYSVRVQEKQRGANGLLRITGVLEEDITPLSVGEEIITLAATAQNPRFGAPFLELRMFDARPLREADTLLPGFYFGACCPDQRYTFTGGVLYESLDGGASWDNVALIEGAAYIGNIAGFTAVDVSGAGWDLINEVTVTMLHGTLESRTEAAVLNGANRAVFGDEIIGYATVEYLGSNQYKLTKLLRGLRGTAEYITQTKTGRGFMQLNQPGVHFKSITAGAINQQRLYKAVARGGYLEEAETIAYTPGGLTVKPLPPVVLSATRDASNNISVEWAPVTRSLGRTFGVNPQLDRLENYQVVYMDETETVTYRTRPKAEERNDTYTAAEQTSDGATPGDTIVAHIVPYSDYFNYNTPSTQVTVS
jgi:hypothetical protein